MVDAIRQRHHLVQADFEVALELATHLGFFFEKGTLDGRRLICKTVFKRIYVEENRVTRVGLNVPFSIIAASAKGSGAVMSGGAGVSIGRTFSVSFSI